MLVHTRVHFQKSPGKPPDYLKMKRGARQWKRLCYFPCECATIRPKRKNSHQGGDRPGIIISFCSSPLTCHYSLHIVRSLTRSEVIDNSLKYNSVTKIYKWYLNWSPLSQIFLNDYILYIDVDCSRPRNFLYAIQKCSAHTLLIRKGIYSFELHKPTF